MVTFHILRVYVSAENLTGRLWPTLCSHSLFHRLLYLGTGPRRQVFSQTKMIWWLSSEVLCKPAPPSPAFPPPSPWNRESRETDGSLNTENSPSWQTPPQQFPPQPHASFAKCDVTTGRVPCLNQSVKPLLTSLTLYSLNTSAS